MKCLIQQPVLAPYRLPVFRALLRSRDVEVHFAASDISATGEVAYDAQNELPMDLLSYRRLPLGFVWQSGLVRSLRHHKSSILCVGYDPHYLSSSYAAWWARRNGVSVVMWGHGVNAKSGKLARWLYRRMAGLADALVFYAEQGAELSVANGVRADRVFVAWNSIDTRKIEKVREAKPFALRKRVVYLGRLTEAKKPILAIRGFAKALPDLPQNTILTLIGDGPESSALREEAVALGIEKRLELTGSIYDDEALAAYMNDSWVCLSPGYVGLSAIHSLAFGVPMLFARDEKHSPEVCALEVDVNALDFESDNADALASKIVNLSRDRELCCRFGISGIETVRTKFSAEAMCNVLVDVMKSAARRKSDEMVRV